MGHSPPGNSKLFFILVEKRWGWLGKRYFC